MHRLAIGLLFSAACLQAQPKLKVWFPPPLAEGSLRAQAREIDAFLDSAGQTWENPGGTSMRLSWAGAEWNLQQPGGQLLALGPNLSRELLMVRLGSGVTLRANLPPPTGLRERMGLSRDPFAQAVEEVSSREQADYELLGRYADYECSIPGPAYGP